jgi:hypothetical protein
MTFSSKNQFDETIGIGDEWRNWRSKEFTVRRQEITVQKTGITE